MKQYGWWGNTFNEVDEDDKVVWRKSSVILSKNLYFLISLFLFSLSSLFFSSPPFCLLLSLLRRTSVGFPLFVIPLPSLLPALLFPALPHPPALMKVWMLRLISDKNKNVWCLEKMLQENFESSSMIPSYLLVQTFLNHPWLFTASFKVSDELKANRSEFKLFWVK